MRRAINWLGTGMGILLLLPTVVAYAGENKIPLDKLPKPVMDSVKNRFNDAVVTSAVIDDTKKPVYEVFLDLKGQKIDLTLTPEGEIEFFEKTIAVKDLPDAVAKAIEDKYPKAIYKRVEEFITVKNKIEKLEYYEALLVTADKSEMGKAAEADKVEQGEEGEEGEEANKGQEVTVKATAEGKIVSVEAGSD